MTMINEVLRRFLDAINSGYGFIGGDVRWLFNTLLVLNVVLAALFWAFSDDQVIVQLIRRALHVGMFAWIIENWQELTHALAHTFVLLGIKAGGGAIQSDILLNPGIIAERGLTLAEPMMNAVHDLAGPVGFFENFPEILLLSTAALAVIVSFFLISIQMVMAILTFKLGTLVAYVLLPFSIITHTTFIAERPLGWVVTSGVRFMLLTLVVGLGDTLFSQLQIDPDKLTVRQALDITLGAIVLMVLALTASRLATDLATGTPRLGALDAAVALSGTALTISYVVKQFLNALFKTTEMASTAVVKAASAIHSHMRGRSAPEAEKPKSESPTAQTSEKQP